MAMWACADVMFDADVIDKARLLVGFVLFFCVRRSV